MSDSVKFEVAEEYSDGGFDGGCIAMPDGSAFDVHAALTDGKGVITLDAAKDAHTIAALDGYPAVQRAKPARAAAHKPKGGDS